MKVASETSNWGVAEVTPIEQPGTLRQEKGSTMRTLLLAGAAAGCLMLGPQIAKADSPIYSFSDSGDSGHLVGSQEFWQYGSGGTTPPNGDLAWGSPGINAGSAIYGESIAATDFEITFNQATIDSTVLGSSCAQGAIVFCSDTGGGNFVQWTPTLVGDNGIVFDAPAGVQLAQNGQYFTDIYLNPDGVSGGSFSGDWSISVPEPAGLSVLGAGLFALGWLRRRRR
jgi:hypothetical protein